MVSRVAAGLMKSASKSSTLSIAVRSMSGSYNPFIHSLDRTNPTKVAKTLDIGDGKTLKIPERIKVVPPPEHAPPIKLTGEVGKITSTIYFYASQQGQLQAVEKDFLTLESSLFGTPVWTEWLGGSGAKTSVKLAILSKYVEGAELSPFMKELLPYFVEQKLLKYLPEIKDQFLKLTRAKRGEIDVFVTSADPLSPEVLKEIEKLIKAKPGMGNKINFVTSVDKELVAGLRIQYKNQLIDNTIARKVGQVKEAWSKAYTEALAL